MLFILNIKTNRDNRQTIKQAIDDSNFEWLTKTMQSSLNYIFDPIKKKDWPINIQKESYSDEWIILSILNNMYNNTNKFKLGFNEAVDSSGGMLCKHRFLFHTKSMRIVYCCVFDYNDKTDTYVRGISMWLNKNDKDKFYIRDHNNGISRVYPFPLAHSDYKFISCTLFHFMSVASLNDIIISYLSYLPPDIKINGVKLPPETKYAYNIRMQINKRIEQLEQEVIDKTICADYR